MRKGSGDDGKCAIDQVRQFPAEKVTPCLRQKITVY